MDPTESADLLLHGGRVYTVDPAVPWAEAIAIQGERIVRVGTDAEAHEHAAPATQVVNLNGRLVLPGFIDGHNHLRLGANEHALQLAGSASMQVVRERIANWIADHPDLDWVEGEGLHYAATEGGGIPTAQHLEGATGGRPAFIMVFDGHNVVLNHEAMARLGITRAVERVPFGIVEKDPGSGEPTGVIGEFATMGIARAGQAALEQFLPGYSKERQYQRLLESLSMATSFGITTVVEPQNSLDDLALFVRARREGHLRSRLIAALFHPPGTTDAELDEFADAGRRFDDDRFRAGPLKLYIDDVIERHTAAMLEPYSSEPMTIGELFYAPDEFAELITRLDARGFQTFTHAIGDRGIRTALDAIERAQVRNGSRDRRHQLVHVECLHPDDISRFAQLGVVACVQPRPFAPALNAEWRAAVGLDRSRYGAAWRSLHDAGAPLAFSSDWNVTEMDPLIGIYTAVTRADLEGGEPWMPDQAVDLPTAIHAYTLAGAHANFCEQDRGSITAGKYADLIVLSQDLFAIPPAEILETRVELTMVSGATEHGSLGQVTNDA